MEFARDAEGQSETITPSSNIPPLLQTGKSRSV
jgi:hypothetical protein